MAVTLESLTSELGDIQTDNYKFNFDENWKGYLVENGFVVIRWMPRAECQQHIDSIWDLLETLTERRLNRDDPTTWVKSANYPFMLHGGMVQYIGHSRFQWDLRERCADVFSALWDCPKTDLSCSFDGFCFMNGVRNYKQQPQTSFLHMDQSPLRAGLSSVQGLVNLVDCDSNSGGLVLVPGSHTMGMFFEESGVIQDTGNGLQPGPAARKDIRHNWYLFSDEEKQRMITQEIPHIKVNCAAGDIVLWDSRTWHCNTVPTTPRLRACVYICMLPKEFVSAETRRKRNAAIQQKRTSSHHPGSGFTLFPILPRFASRHLLAYLPMVQLNPADMTPLQKTLADYEDDALPI